MDHAGVSDRCIVEVIRDNEKIRKIVKNEEQEKETISKILVKGLIKIILNREGK